MTIQSLRDGDSNIQYIDWYPGVAAAVFYGLISGSMSFMNKIVLTTFDYRYPEVIMLVQVTCTALILEICRRLKLLRISAFTWKRAKDFMMPSVCFALHTILALNALSDLSIPMYNILRRLLPLSTLILGACVLSKKPSFQLSVSIILVVLGCITAGIGDLSFHLGGYTSAILSVCSQALYLIYVQKTGIENDLSTLDVLHMNSINCIPLLTIWTMYDNRLIKSINSIKVTAKGFFPVFIVDVLLGCILNYSLFLCATMNSALTTSLVGVIKGIITTIIGFFTFGGVALNPYTISGILLNTLGGILYFYTKYQDRSSVKLPKNDNNNMKTSNGSIKNDCEQSKNSIIDIETKDYTDIRE